MKKEQILKKIIEKAVKNGYDFMDITQFEESDSHYSDVWFFHNGFDYLIPEFIFSHNFAKAFWKREYKQMYNKKYDNNTRALLEVIKEKEDWQYNLQQMVLEEDPLLYLKKFIK